ncbi:hypothetical protein V7S43_011738 [Phytophthora oleae]|uniref:MARVEL domain-containing protein n=1 Tax=Phytophthora oleae TaxID=2107226 RepID=A0ABD3F926_9STRA
MTPLHSRILSLLDTEMAFSLAPFVITLLCMLLRGFQLVFALVSLITATMSFPKSTADGNGYRLGSAESTSALLVGYTIVEYSAAFLLLVELFPMILRPRAAFTRASDVFLAILALVSGIILASGDYIQHCDDYTDLVHCSNLKASSVFLLLTVVPLTGSFLLTFVKAEDPRLAAIECRDRAGSYRMVTTPMSSTPPIDNREIVTA